MTLKALRREHGWSLDKTAQETGVSKAMLGQIEREESSPTIATLWKIASGFQTSFSQFIDDLSKKTNYPIRRSDKIQPLEPADKNIRITPLFPFDEQLRCEIFVIELQPHAELLSSPHKLGVIEHVIVVEGTMQVLLNRTWKVLREGEGLRFDAHKPHGYKNNTNSTARFHNIIHYTL